MSRGGDRLPKDSSCGFGDDDVIQFDPQNSQLQPRGVGGKILGTRRSLGNHQHPRIVNAQQMQPRVHGAPGLHQHQPLQQHQHQHHQHQAFIPSHLQTRFQPDDTNHEYNLNNSPNHLHSSSSASHEQPTRAPSQLRKEMPSRAQHDRNSRDAEQVHSRGGVDPEDGIVLNSHRRPLTSEFQQRTGQPSTYYNQQISPVSRQPRHTRSRSNGHWDMRMNATPATPGSVLGNYGGRGSARGSALAGATSTPKAGATPPAAAFEFGPGSSGAHTPTFHPANSPAAMAAAAAAVASAGPNSSRSVRNRLTTYSSLRESRDTDPVFSHPALPAAVLTERTQRTERSSREREVNGPTRISTPPLTTAHSSHARILSNSGVTEDVRNSHNRDSGKRSGSWNMETAAAPIATTATRPDPNGSSSTATKVRSGDDMLSEECEKEQKKGKKRGFGRDSKKKAMASHKERSKDNNNHYTHKDKDKEVKEKDYEPVLKQSGDPNAFSYPDPVMPVTLNGSAGVEEAERFEQFMLRFRRLHMTQNESIRFERMEAANKRNQVKTKPVM
eukprot:CAMPEP_0175165936 /NCGR_PEP_ID=MMETSP0087-20121206/27393_1 /TAXON_ID=136419 /ORGANISM="Unknown Unknown, Strain D1" /LENGTH=555 /DNA_ID=CAMNT_0016455429 /DNA_START=238 /DNA_END=1902 /DNA_ORIENTATION=-